ncbi:hypothetical protein [Candidatus Cyanaurora vandensis]|uniref:hypothetical protein n=1 Tax=Candidatus Cyanaurora vandensis TaxID=2714958 RepID=UPI00258025CC|nr:hypothetical protein [Candidatus Cyanaurora vandensis]
MALTNDLELTFRKAWLLLYAQGVGEGYINALRQFIKAAIAAYESGYSLEALNLELLADQKVTGDETLDEMLRLTEEELQIRTNWLKLVFMTLDRARPRDPEAPPLTDDGLDNLVNGVIDSQQRGYTLESLKLEIVLETGGSDRTPGETAILSQWMRLVFLTLEQAL